MGVSSSDVGCDGSCDGVGILGLGILKLKTLGTKGARGMLLALAGSGSADTRGVEGAEPVPGCVSSSSFTSHQRGRSSCC